MSDGINFVVVELNDDELLAFKALVSRLPDGSLKTLLQEAIDAAEEDV